MTVTLIAMLLIAACSRGADVELDATKLTLELHYSLDAAAQGSISGSGWSGAGWRVGHLPPRRDHDWRVAEGEAAPDGAFELALDARPWPFESLAPTA